MPSPISYLVALALGLVLVPASAQSIFINELHYDNSGGDANEGVEIAGPAGSDLGPYKLVFYNGANGTRYDELPLGGTLPAQNGSAFGTAFFPVAGIQNGAPDGIALIDTVANSVVQFLSYEGSFRAVGGEADGASSTDIGVSETGATPASSSLQLVGDGAVSTDFSWQPPAPASPGNINPGQTFIGAGSPAITLTLMPATLAEGSTGTATLAVFPPPGNALSVTIHNPDETELLVPGTVTVPASGSTEFTVAAIDDHLNDGAQQVTLTASAAGDRYAPGSATARVLDIQRPARGTAVRVATVNTLNGVGARGSSDYAALLAVIERIEPDIIAFQEVSAAADFFDLRQLLADLGVPHLATTGDAFAGQPYEGGSFTSDQNLAVASRYPITSTTQIGRGEAGRAELTRFPLMVGIDVPGTSNDPVVIAVHYKASSDDASRLRKAVEAYRTLEAIAAAGLDGTGDNLFVLGDFNEDHGRFMPASYSTGLSTFADGSSLPVSYQLGSDLSGANAITLPYAQFPDRIFGNADLLTPIHHQQDGVATRTFLTLGDAALDYILHSRRVAENGNTPSEIFNSSLDRAFAGLPKQASPTPPGTSFAASDHLAIFGDYELDAKPHLTLAITPARLREDAGAGAASGTVTLSAATATPLLVTLSSTRADAPIHLPADTLTFNPGETQQGFRIDIIARASADADLAVTISANADGYSGDSDRLAIDNLEASGRILLSQYTEPPSGSAPRGIELFNCGTSDIDLRAEPIRVSQYTNGSRTGSVVAVANFGLLRAGAVVVIGDASIGDFLVGQGLLAAPPDPFASAENGSHYLNADGELVYVKEFFAYNGDDALEVEFAFGLADVFGSIGQDPGSAWQSDGVTTSGRNLALRGDVATPSTGFTRPHTRFDDAGPGNDLAGFGVPPAADDPFKAWLRGFGLTDPNADADCDGLPNLVEFATGSDPLDPASAFHPSFISGTFAHRERSVRGRLGYAVEQSADLRSWSPASLNLTGSSDNGDGTTTRRYAAPPVAGARSFLRLRVNFE